MSILSNQKDSILVVLFCLILMMIILPLPTFLMDMLITVNICISITILLMALHLKNPVQFSTFPSILLVTTLFRLAISISTTRLILLEGDAGKIVETFGNVVVGGNLVVGLVIFLIITVVQFLVITKGADRVAEVGARFTLDGMPGKQMSVDADVRAGLIDKYTAKNSRLVLERETKLFGAMDGAMKFVKGDATAGLVITAINLIGGIAIGMAQLGMPFGEAIELYALMTIGDGLVAQIPALLISVAAATIVTRVTNPDSADLGTEISEQLTANGRTVMGAGILIALFGLIPGFPTLIFWFFGLLMTGGIYYQMRKQKNEINASLNEWDEMYAYQKEIWDSKKLHTGALETVKLVLPNSIKEQPQEPYYLLNIIHHFKNALEARVGISLDYWSFEFHDSESNEFKVYLKQNLIHTSSLDFENLFVKANKSYLDALEIPVEKHFGSDDGAVVKVDYKQTLIDLNVDFLDFYTEIGCRTNDSILANQSLLATFQNVSNILDALDTSNPVLVGSIRDTLTIGQICQIYRMLLSERIGLTDHTRILEAILNASMKKTDPNEILQDVRIAIGDLITKSYAPNNFLPVVIVSPVVENHLREGYKNSKEGNFVVLQPELSRHISEQAKEMINGAHVRQMDMVIITQQDTRYSLAKILDKQGVFVPVIAYQEVPANIIIYPTKYIGLPDEVDNLVAA